MVEDVPQTLDEQIGAMCACVAEAFCSVLNHGTDLGPLDAQLLLDYVQCAGMHVSNVVRALRPAFRSANHAERRAEIAGGTSFTFEPDVMTRSRLVANLALGAIGHGRAARAESGRLASDARKVLVLEELDVALDHLNVVIFLTDPATFVPGPGADDVERILYAEVRDICERDVAESRARLSASWN